MNLILLIILFVLMVLLGGVRGLKLFLSLLFNFIILMVSFYLMALGVSPIVVSFIACFIIIIVLLYFVNGKNIKTRTSFLAVLIILVLLLLLIMILTKRTLIAGFGYESYEEINMFSYDVHLDFTNIAVALVLIGLIGAVVDASMAITSALYEVYQNNKNLSQKELFKSGLTIGKDILGTTMNTLLFAFLSEFMTLFFWFQLGGYSILDIINNKTFATEVIKIMICALGCVFIIPLSAFLLAYRLRHPGEVEDD